MTTSKGPRLQPDSSQAERPVRDSAPWVLEGAPPQAPRDMPVWVYWLALAVLTVGGAAIRAAWLDHPMRYDESWTYLFYVMPEDLTSALAYSAPNNHVLHTLLVAGAHWLAGNRLIVLRMPAFLAGVALIPAAAYLARVLSGRRLAGLLAAAFVGGSSILVDYSVNARGYTMFCLAAVLLGERTVRIGRNVRPWGPWVGWTLLATAGLFTIPVMVYPMVVLAVVLLLQAFLGPGDPAARRLALRRTVAALAASAFLGFLLYIPVFRATGLATTEDNPAARTGPLAVYRIGWHAIVANPIMGSRPLVESAASLPRVGAEAIGEWTRETAWPWSVLAVGGLVAAVAVGLWRRRAFYLLPLLLPVVLPALALAQRVVPFARLWLFALPLLAVVASCGLAELAYRARPGWLRAAAMPVVLLAVAGAQVEPVLRLLQPGRRILGECSLVDARAIVTDALELADARTGLAWDYEVPTWPPLVYYMVTLQSESRHFVPYLQDDCRRVLVVVPKVESLQTVLERRKQLAATYGAPFPWRSYPSADVYIAFRRP